MYVFDEALFNRHSVRRFERRPVESKSLWSILNAGRLAPSAKNSQPWNFTVLTDENKRDICLEMLNSAEGVQKKGTVVASAKIIKTAPAAVAVTAPRGGGHGVLPDSLKRMTEGGFWGCSNLRVLIIPRDILGLERQSFETCPYVNVDAGGFCFRNGKAM